MDDCDSRLGHVTRPPERPVACFDRPARGRARSARIRADRRRAPWGHRATEADSCHARRPL